MSMINDEGHPVYACDLCDKIFHDKSVLQEHAVSHLADLAQFNALRDVSSDNHCRHCGTSFSSMHRVFRHIITKCCPVLDPNKTWTTYLDQHATLKHLVHTGNIQAILQQPDLLKIFDLTCTLCCRQFKRKNDLQAHLLNIHAQYWKQVEAFVLKLVNHFQGSAVNCYCTPKTKQWGKHQCSVFRQFALLRHVVFPELTNDHLIPRPMQPPNTETSAADNSTTDPPPVNRYINIMDCLRRSSVVTMQPLPVTGIQVDSSPYQDFSSQEYMDDQELAENLERMLCQPHDTVMPLIDKVQLSFSGGGAIPCSPEFAQHLFPDVLPAARHLMDTALGSDYQAMTAKDEVAFFSTRCVLCNYQFASPEEVWAHMSTHIIQMHPSISMYSLGTVLIEFLTVCNALGNTSQQKLVQAALKQQFALRVAALHHGRGRRQDESDDRSLEAHPATRGHTDHEKDAGEQQHQPGEKEAASRKTTNVNQEGGHKQFPDDRSLEDVGPADAPSGESTEMSQFGSRIHPSHRIWRRRNLGRDGHPDSPMASGREDRSPTLEVGTPCHEDHQSTTEPIGPLPKRIRVVDPDGQRGPDLGNGRPSVLDMGLQDTEAGSNEAATTEDGRGTIHDGGIGEVLPRSELGHEVPFFEESYSGSSSPELTMVPDDFQQVPSGGLPTFDGSLLALHLATRPYPVETSGASAVQSGGSTQEGEQSSLRQVVKWHTQSGEGSLESQRPLLLECRDSRGHMDITWCHLLGCISLEGWWEALGYCESTFTFSSDIAYASKLQASLEQLVSAGQWGTST